MSVGTRTRTRDVARAAVRADLAQVALELFLRDGFDEVTISQVAEASGVSRNTFMRYFETKEDAVLDALEAQGERVANALRERPLVEDEWVALRHALEIVVKDYQADPDSSLATARLIRGTPSLLARQLAKECGWRPLLAGVLAERTAPGGLPTMAQLVRVAAALGALGVTVDHWAVSGGQGDLGKLLDSAFEAMVPRASDPTADGVASASDTADLARKE